MPTNRISGNHVKPKDIKRFNRLAKAGQSPMVLINGQWYAWEESDPRGKEIFVSDNTGGEHEVSLDQIDMVDENVLPNQTLSSQRSLNEMAKVSYDQADKMIGDIVAKYPPGKDPKRVKFLFKQVFLAMKKGYGNNERQFIAKANDIVLKYRLDLDYNRPLFRTKLTMKDL